MATHPTTDDRQRDPETGRFLARAATMIPEMSAGLAQALLDADAEAWRVRQTTLQSAWLVGAIEFGDRIASGEAGS